MTKFTIDKRYNHIGIGWTTVDELLYINAWCEQQGGFDIYATGIVYHREKDLTAFLLRWS